MFLYYICIFFSTGWPVFSLILYGIEILPLQISDLGHSVPVILLTFLTEYSTAKLKSNGDKISTFAHCELEIHQRDFCLREICYTPDTF